MCVFVTGTVNVFAPPKSKRQRKYRSIISDIFDGTIVSSVQCLTCDRVSHADTRHHVIAYAASVFDLALVVCSVLLRSP